MPKALKQLVKKITTGNPYSAGASTMKKRSSKPMKKKKKPMAKKRMMPKY